MPTTAPTQQGTAWKIGFGSLAYTATPANYTPEDGLTVEPQGTVTEITDTNDECITAIISNPSRTLNAVFMIGSSGSIDEDDVKPGTKLTLTNPKGDVTSYMAMPGCRVEHSRMITKLTIVAKAWPNITLA
jgi:hypothetical protein